MAYVLIVLHSVATPSGAGAQRFGSFACSPSPDDVDAALEAHGALRASLRYELEAANHAYRQLNTILRAVHRGERILSPAEHASLVASHGEARDEAQRLRAVYGEWAACYDELVRLRRFYPRSVHHLRLSLGFDGAMWTMPNTAEDLAEEYPHVWFRTPSAALQIGWERFYTRRLGVQVNGTFAAGQGRLRACTLERWPSCYGEPPAGGAVSVAVDAGVRIWATPLLIIGLSLELRVTRLPITERIQNGNRYSVSEQVIPAMLLRLGPEVPLSRDGRWWVSPSYAYGRLLTQRGGVNAVALRLGYLL